MNKILVYLLGFFAVMAPSLEGMDGETFAYLATLYQSHEISRRQLLNAYGALESDVVKAAADDLLEGQGISIEHLAEREIIDLGNYTQTFDTLISLYKDGELSRADLINAYHLFETDSDKKIGDRLLEAFLQKTIQELIQEEAQGTVQRRHRRASVPARHQQAPHRNCNVIRCNMQRTNPAPVNRAQQAPRRQLDPRSVQAHLNMVKDQKNRRNAAILKKNERNKRAEEEYKALMQELALEKSPQEKGPRKKKERSAPVDVVKDSVPGKKHPTQKQAKLAQKTQPQEDTMLQEPAESLEESREESHEESMVEPQHDAASAALEQELAQVQALRQKEASYVLQNLQNDVVHESDRPLLDDEFPQAISIPQPRQHQEKHVHFASPVEQRSKTQQDRIDELRRYAQPSRQVGVEEADEPRNKNDQVGVEPTVHLSISRGTPVFTHGAQVINPHMPDLFNKSVASTNNATIQQWGQQLATLAKNDEDRVRVLQPIVNAANQVDAPREKIKLLIQPTLEGFVSRAAFEELMARVAR